ncbi:hypothetical protein AB0873_08265 [Micromonospora sp. NPDC047707]|uniref:hypothetical protein n=1 Tax=Micromonospora sp. NPDC047707 TaxID=3154498 RepID=UPI00345414F1
MIVASLLLIVLAVVLLVIGLAGGSSLLLVISIAASLLAAVALVAGARQVAAARVTAERIRPRGGPAPAGAYGPAVDPGVPVQHVPPADDDGSGWRQPPEPPTADPSAGVEPLDDEPAAQDVPVGDAARLARLDHEVRVVDGRPRYHLAGCPHLVGREHEPVPVAEAVDLGFTPCAHCAPVTALLAEDGRIASGGAGA